IFRATINRFFKGWVIRPIEYIIKTLRAGKSSSLEIMSKDGLNSELHSLERMAISFGQTGQSDYYFEGLGTGNRGDYLFHIIVLQQFFQKLNFYPDD
ncbi:hypothetical protein PPACK8108_LOCUS10339, partial [Phakopsora pachyrhizi]